MAPSSVAYAHATPLPTGSAPDAPSLASDATSPFAGLQLPLRRALEGRGFTTLTPVQDAVLEDAGADRDLRISSQTGSGKTVALGLVMAPRLIEAVAAGSAVGPRALVIAPTRELAAQVRSELQWLYAGVPGLRVECVTGGTSVGQERRRLARRPALLVGTPGRLLDHLRSGALLGTAVEQLVLDEADQMLDMGFRDELEAILDALPAERRTHLVSATFPDEVRGLAERYQSAPRAVEGTVLGAAHEDIEHVVHLVRPQDRYGALVNLLLLAGRERVLVFVRTRADTATVAGKLADDGFAALPLSGDLPQARRTQTLTAFRTGAVTVLVATDVAARGLDVPDVSMVVHGDPPFDAAAYVHRSGRTGRAGRKGRSVLLAGVGAERRMHRLLAQAGVEAQWGPVPSGEQIERAVEKDARRRLHRALEAAAPSEAELSYARALLEDRDAARVVATLLAASRAALPRQPFRLEPAEPRAARVGTGGRPRPGGPAPRRPQRFSINWGARDGADPRRLLAHVCRRGGIRGRSIGSIDIGPRSATFEVASDVAGSFERRAMAPDVREPHLRIRRCGGSPPRHAPRCAQG